jgi:uncharacterized protein (TIGR03435 family)
MSEWGRRVYRLLLWMHPKAFREEFGPEMAMDFEDGVRDGKAGALYWDGVVSLGRQWMLRGGAPAAQVRAVEGPCLLSGRYGMIGVDRLTPFELLRGMVVSTAIIAVLALAPTRRARSSVQPMNAVGMRGQTAAGTRSMQRGGEGSEANVRAQGPMAMRLATQAASSAEMQVVPADVAAATAEAISGIPMRAQLGTAAVVAKPRFAEFDVVSVRENRKGGEPTSNFPMGPKEDGYTKTGGVFRVTNLSLPGYIAFAYGLNSSQNSAMREQVPAWARTTRYDIEARVDGEPTKDEMRGMVRALLADRFGLQIHPEQHEAAVFDLEMVKPGKVGPALKVHAADDPDCSADVPGYFSPCGAMAIMAAPVMKMAGRNVTLEDFADFSGTPAGRVVVDRTGLSGRWDITLDFVPDFAPDSTPPPRAKAAESAPAFPQALKEQLGLKLVPARAMVQTYVIDGVERPTGN